MSARDIIAVCQKHLPIHSDNCSGFVRAVANDCGVMLFGNANEIVEFITAEWEFLSDGKSAAAAAAEGKLVVAGASAARHGHVVVVVDGPMSSGHSQKYPYCFWGQYRSMTVLGETINVGFTRGHGCLNYAFGPNDRERVVYRYARPLELIMPKATGTQGMVIHKFT